MGIAHNHYKIKPLKSPYVWATIAVVVVLGFFIINRGHSPFPRKTISSSSETKGKVSLSSSNSRKSNPDPSKPSVSSNPKGINGSGAVTLLTPNGNFVSNHRPNLSGSPAPNKMSSVCNTTPGASCIIRFTNPNNQSNKSLPVKTTDAGGSAFWDWKLQDIGLTAGTWHIEASASLQGQTKVAADAIDLEVAE